MLHETAAPVATRKLRSIAKARNVLIIEDDRTMGIMVAQQLRGHGFKTQIAGDGATARKILSNAPDSVDVILVDRTLPDADGADLARSFMTNPALATKPIIMLTGSGESKDIKEGVDSGVFYYLVKPVDAEVLLSVIASAMRRADAQNLLFSQIGSCRAAMVKLSAANFEFKTPDEARQIAVLLSEAYPEPERALVGIVELMLNAIEHGNLDIGYSSKLELLKGDGLTAEIDKRLSSPKYCNRKARVSIAVKEQGIYLTIEDEGNGFDPKKFLQADFARRSTICGRGIAQARSISFDKIGYSKKGNQVVTFASRQAVVQW